MRHRHARRVRSRHQTKPGHWHVRARVERFVEPALLLLLRERPHHGYELIERLPEVAGGASRGDVGHLYPARPADPCPGRARARGGGGGPGPGGAPPPPPPPAAARPPPPAGRPRRPGG